MHKEGQSLSATPLSLSLSGAPTQKTILNAPLIHHIIAGIFTHTICQFRPLTTRSELSFNAQLSLPSKSYTASDAWAKEDSEHLQACMAAVQHSGTMPS